MRSRNRRQRLKLLVLDLTLLATCVVLWYAPIPPRIEQPLYAQVRLGMAKQDVMEMCPMPRLAISVRPFREKASLSEGIWFDPRWRFNVSSSSRTGTITDFSTKTVMGTVAMWEGEKGRLRVCFDLNDRVIGKHLAEGQRETFDALLLRYAADLYTRYIGG